MRERLTDSALSLKTKKFIQKKKKNKLKDKPTADKKSYLALLKATISKRLAELRLIIV